MRGVKIRPGASKPPTRRTTRAIRDNIFIFQRITSWHPPIASFASPLFNYFIPKGFSEQLFLKPKGSYKKDEMLFPVSYCSHLYKPIPFLLCTSSSFPLVRNGPSAAAAPYWTATPCAQGVAVQYGAAAADGPFLTSGNEDDVHRRKGIGLYR